MDGKVLRIENAIDTVKIEPRCITECYVSKASLAWTAYKAKTQVFNIDKHSDWNSTNYKHNKSIEHSRSCQTHE